MLKDPASNHSRKAPLARQTTRRNARQLKAGTTIRAAGTSGTASKTSSDTQNADPARMRVACPNIAIIAWEQLSRTLHCLDTNNCPSINEITASIQPKPA